jgi:hypothetical protein
MADLPETFMADNCSVILRGVPVPLNSDVGQAFIVDCCRNAEGSLSDDDLKAKWGLTDGDMAALSADGRLLDSIRIERQRRIFGGSAAREAAAYEAAKAPRILGAILSDDDMLARHRIEAARELRATAAARAADAGGEQKITIRINLGEGDVFHREAVVEPANSKPDVDQQS